MTDYEAIADDAAHEAYEERRLAECESHTVWITLTVPITGVILHPDDRKSEVLDQVKKTLHLSMIDVDDCYNLKVIDWEPDGEDR